MCVEEREPAAARQLPPMPVLAARPVKAEAKFMGPGTPSKTRLNYVRTLKERIATRPALAKLAKSIALRQMHAGKLYRRPDVDKDFTPENEPKVNVTYGNGEKVYVNRNSTECRDGAVVVAAKSFRLVR